VVLVFFFGTAMLVMAWFSVTMEMKYLLLSVINIYSLSLIYWLYRLITVNIKLQTDDEDPYRFTRRFLTFFLATIVILVLATIIYSIICFRNMLRGLYVLTVFGRSAKEEDNEDTSTSSKRRSAIHQQRIRDKERESRIILD
ncbi:3098_t:CDS:2, partial [Racocetra persica]